MAVQNDIEATLVLLARAESRFIVVGGVAVVLHGHLRLTADLDIVLQLERENVRRTMDALAADGFVPRAPVRLQDFADPLLRRRWVEEKHLQVLSLWNRRRPGFELDLFAEEPFDFEAVFARAELLDLSGTCVRIASIDDLIVLKRTAGRPRDLEDVAALERLKQARGK